jgi:hypothetical protein
MTASPCPEVDPNDGVSYSEEMDPNDGVSLRGVDPYDGSSYPYDGVSMSGKGSYIFCAFCA